ncbi:MAG: oxidoreductase [Winogradskyella sp.]|uniref:WD40/YVTN/BNR-like repeat-containing protein n=1 Tax=Winogradskyella sp. TaxID=1883156 RepID=UPI000F4013F1|nr:oxidoreductase [Winogradskyella sp.]RNC87333.1 MAG: oxidoreductase [Winogradskyella sp.]
MKYTYILFLLVFFCSCKDDYKRPEIISKVTIDTIIRDSILSARALDFNKDYLFYGSSDHFGKYALNKELKFDIDNLKLSNSENYFKHIVTHEEKPLHFRAIEIVYGNMFVISVGNPGKLYKLNRKAKNPKLVYEEHHEKVFYDSMDFWNENEGIAIGDPTDDCMSIIITRDGGHTWNKISCTDLPKANDGEAAFAASDTNIAIVGDNTWVATGGTSSRILYSPDKGNSWQVFDTPIVQGKPTTGMYSVDFYDENNGFAIGGDYTKPNDTLSNKIRTQDGGKTWQVVADGQSPGYRSCVQYVPNSNAQELVAIGFKGIDYSNDAGESWKHLSDEGFYTIRFLNDSVAYAAGRGRISKLIFK